MLSLALPLSASAPLWIHSLAQQTTTGAYPEAIRLRKDLSSLAFIRSRRSRRSRRTVLVPRAPSAVVPVVGVDTAPKEAVVEETPVMSFSSQLSGQEDEIWP